MLAKRADFDLIGKKYNINPVLARIIRNRDIITDEQIEKFLKCSEDDIYNPWLFKDIEKAVDLLINKIAQGKKIRIIGDYDIDGICSTYILYRGLKMLGANIDTAIPHRIRDGYGLNENLISEAYEAGTDTVVTCDNGIAALNQIEYANSLGMTVIITDHHEIPYEMVNDERKYNLPDAAAIVDPKQIDCKYPFKEVCGAVVAYKLILAIVSKIKNCEWREIMKSELGEELMELATFATVGDVMELRDENRIIVKKGLSLIGNTKNIGLKALMEVTGTNPKTVSPYTIGFVLGPCINATGRLDTALNALKLLMSDNEADAMNYATMLKEINDSRKELTVKGVEAAVQQIEENGLKNDKVLVIYLPEVHESLAGIIAGRIREKYYKPTFVLTKGEEGVKGSGRSIDAFHMYDEMTKCKELFTKYGGHKLAAGLSLPEENVEAFRRALNDNCKLTEEDFSEKVLIDVPMPFSYVTFDLINQLDLLEPFGNGNIKPQFGQKNVRFIKGRLLGEYKNVGKYTIADEVGNKYEMIYFGDIESFNEYMISKFGIDAVENLYSGRSSTETEITLAVVYYPEINEYRGEKSIQMVMKYYK